VEGNWDWRLWAVFEKKAQHLYRKICYCFPGRDVAILTSTYEICMGIRQEKYISIGSDSQVALKLTEAAKTTYNSNIRH